jgi:hypothetical protein
MGLYDTIHCDYPLPDLRLQDAEFQTKSLDCAMQRYTITADGRLLRHPGGGLFDEPPRRFEKDVEVPIHGDIEMHESWSPSPVEEWVEYTVRFTHGRVEWIRPMAAPQARPATREPPALKEDAAQGLPRPDVMGRRLSPKEFSAHTPEKLELLYGEIPGEKALLMLLLTKFGLRRTAALVGYDLWRRALPEISTTESEEGK